MEQREERPMVERNGARLGRLAAGVVISSVVLAAILFGMDRLVHGAIRDEIQLRQLDPVSVPLRKLRADEQSRLGHYQWTDEKKGTVRIPVERASELILKEWNARPEGLAPVPAPEAPAVPTQGTRGDGDK